MLLINKKVSNTVEMAERKSGEINCDKTSPIVKHFVHQNSHPNHAKKVGLYIV
jgi:hypothetical protein